MFGLRRAPSAPQKIVRILSIDGGGIRGLMPAVVLAEIEARLGRPIHELFHMVAGTSTGAVLGLGLTKPQPFTGRQMMDLYKDCGPRIFHTNIWRKIGNLNGLAGPYYDHLSWEKVLAETMGDHRLSDCNSDVLVAAYDMEKRMPAIFKSWRAQGERLGNERTSDALDFKLRDIARGSSAAPTYFEPARISAANGDLCTLVDGGVYANNPAALALSSAARLYPNRDGVLVVSLGTGQTARPYPFREARKWGRPQWAMPVIEILGGAVDDTIDYQMETLLMPHEYFRLQIDLNRREPLVPAPSDDLDDVSSGNISKLEARARLMLQEQKGRFERVLDALSDPLIDRNLLIET